MKTAKIVITDSIDKKIGSTTIKIEVCSGKRGKGVSLFTTRTSMQYFEAWQRYYSYNRLTFGHSPLTLALRKCYRFCVENKIRLV